MNWAPGLQRPIHLSAKYDRFPAVAACATMILEVMNMTTQLTRLQVGFEEALLGAVRGLPPQRAVQVLDFARWLRTQAEPGESLTDDTTEKLQVEEALWDQVYLENRETFRVMAREALEQYEAGETQEMFIRDGRLSAR